MFNGCLVCKTDCCVVDKIDCCVVVVCLVNKNELINYTTQLLNSSINIISSLKEQHFQHDVFVGTYQQVAF